MNDLYKLAADISDYMWDNVENIKKTHGTDVEELDKFEYSLTSASECILYDNMYLYNGEDEERLYDDVDDNYLNSNLGDLIVNMRAKIANMQNAIQVLEILNDVQLSEQGLL